MTMKKCDHTDTRLTCVDCSAPICPFCMVQCAVGNRCKVCTKGTDTHITKLTPIDIIKVVSLSFASSIAIFIAYMGIGMIPVIGCMFKIIAAGACAYFSGKLIHKASGYKYGRKLLPYVLIPMLFGLTINPLTSPLTYFAAAYFTGMPVAIVFDAFLLPAIAALTMMIPFTRV